MVWEKEVKRQRTDKGSEFLEERAVVWLWADFYCKTPFNHNLMIFLLTKLCLVFNLWSLAVELWWPSEYSLLPQYPLSLSLSQRHQHQLQLSRSALIN